MNADHRNANTAQPGWPKLAYYCILIRVPFVLFQKRQTHGLLVWFSLSGPSGQEIWRSEIVYFFSSASVASTQYPVRAFISYADLFLTFSASAWNPGCGDWGRKLRK